MDPGVPRDAFGTNVGFPVPEQQRNKDFPTQDSPRALCAGMYVLHHVLDMKFHELHLIDRNRKSVCKQMVWGPILGIWCTHLDCAFPGDP